VPTTHLLITIIIIIIIDLIKSEFMEEEVRQIAIDDHIHDHDHAQKIAENWIKANPGWQWTGVWTNNELGLSSYIEVTKHIEQV
jgi:hypothetical protein